jgi:PAS domain S-box-containing protein
VSFGALLFVIAVVHHATELYAIDGLVGPIVALILDGTPALGLVYAGYWLTGTDLSPENRWQVWVWCFVGATLFVTIMMLSILVRAVEGRVIGEALFPLLIATEAGGIAGFVGGYQTARARTEARRAQSASDALRERTRQLQAVLDGVEAAIWIRDTDSRFVLMNHHYRTLLDIDEDTEVAGKPLEEVVPRDIAEDIRDCDKQVLKTEQSVEMEETIETNQGQRTFLARISPLFEDGDPYATCGIASDITEQKEYERTIEQQNERLEQLASVVSHDLRNPLNVADGRLELAREECDSDHLEHIAKALDRMEALIEDLLRLARDGETATDPNLVDLAEIATDCWSNIDTADATLFSDVDRAIHADESRLKQVFENLIRNAVEHGHDDVTITIGEVADGFYVKDDGPGIPEDERDEVFDAGYSTNYEGTGLGLNIIKKVADAHDWTVTLTESEEGGARFEITGVGNANE